MFDTKNAPLIKICGIQRLIDIKIINEYEPDFIGFVFYPKSKRYVSKEKAMALKSALNPKIKSVGVFVNENISDIVSLVKSQCIDIIQLHGNEDNSYIQRLKNTVNVPIIKAFLEKDDPTFDMAKTSKSDLILLDTGFGTGSCFNWDNLKYIDRPYMLAGGIGLDNIDKALKLKPLGLDVSSKLEINGFKDEKLIKSFMSKINDFRDHLK